MNAMMTLHSEMEEKPRMVQGEALEVPCHQEVTVMTKEIEYCPFCGLFFSKS